MGFRDRLSAAFNAFTGKAPLGKAEATPFFYSHSGAGQPSQNTKVSPQKLRAFSETAIVRRAVEYIRNQVARLDWDLQPRNGKKFTAAQKKQVDTIKNVFNKPNFDDNWMTFIGQMIEDMLVIGSGAFEIKKWDNNDVNPYLLYPVDSSSIQVYLDWNGSPDVRRYAQLDYRGTRIDFKPTELVVMKHNPRSNTPFGLSPLETSFQQIQYFLDAQAFSGKTASNATPKKMLFLGQEITDNQLKEFRQYFKDEIEGRSSIPIIGGTDDVKSIELGKSDDNALFLKWQSFLISIIASNFGLDAMKFNAFVGVNRSTGDTLDDTSDEGAIRPMALSLEHYMDQLLSILGIGDFAEFKFRFTTSFSDRKATAVIAQIYGQLDALTINEIRQEMGRPPLEEKDDATGKSIGDTTVSVYRARYGSPQQAMQEDEEMESTSTDEEKGLPNGDDTKTGHEETNNGVNGASKPSDTAMNKRNDKAMTV